MTSFQEQLEAVNTETKLRIYERLWYELTIAGRAVWSEPTQSVENKLEGLKWINEIQHRVWGAHADAKTGDLRNIEGIIADHVGQAPHIRVYVQYAIKNALLAVNNQGSEDR